MCIPILNVPVYDHHYVYLVCCNKAYLRYSVPTLHVQILNPTSNAANTIWYVLVMPRHPNTKVNVLWSHFTRWKLPSLLKEATGYLSIDGSNSRSMIHMEANDLWGICCGVGARRRFAKNIQTTSKLSMVFANKIRTLVHRTSEKKKRCEQESRAVTGLLLPFAGPITYYSYLSRERNFLFLRFFGLCPQNTSKY